jgi:hypothetical protein
MKTLRAFQLLLICLLTLAAVHAEALAQNSQGSDRDSSSNARRAKSTASKSYIAKSFDTKQQADVSAKMHGRVYAGSDNAPMKQTKA